MISTLGLSIPTMTTPPPPTLKERETTYFFEPRKFHHHYQGCLDSSQFASVSRSRWIRTQAFSRDYRPLLGGAPIGGSPVTYMGGVLVYGLTWWERKGVRLLPSMSGFAKSQKTCTNCGVTVVETFPCTIMGNTSFTPPHTSIYEFYDSIDT